VEAVVWVFFGVVFVALATGRMPWYRPAKLSKTLMGIAGVGGFLLAGLVLSGH
jgi:hypothetical protein